jgi:phosphate starvation-inducible protein PhoH and related proteins
MSSPIAPSGPDSSGSGTVARTPSAPVGGSKPVSSPPEVAGIAKGRTTRTVDIAEPDVLMTLVRAHGQMLSEVAKHSGAQVNVRGNTILVSGNTPDVEVAERFLSGAIDLLRSGVSLGPEDVARSLRTLRDEPALALSVLLDETILISGKTRPIVPKSPAQRAYVAQIKKHDLTFGIGPAGTGKTYLAMAMAAQALLQRQVKRVILTRPAVEAGEKLGFLPGDLIEKINPYLRPLYDALNDMVDYEKVEQLRARGQIEVAPLAFMRGRTLNDAFVILDEAQNATREQMRMFLTRLGFGSKAVVTGDITQTDLPRGATSGLREATELLAGVEGVAISRFGDRDVVRHPLVQRIVVAYERQDERRAASPGSQPRNEAEKS